jgi:hypothetical protein
LVLKHLSMTQQQQLLRLATCSSRQQQQQGQMAVLLAGLSCSMQLSCRPSSTAQHSTAQHDRLAMHPCASSAPAWQAQHACSRLSWRLQDGMMLPCGQQQQRRQLLPSSSTTSGSSSRMVLVWDSFHRALQQQQQSQHAAGRQSWRLQGTLMLLCGLLLLQRQPQQRPQQQRQQRRVRRPSSSSGLLSESSSGRQRSRLQLPLLACLGLSLHLRAAQAPRQWVNPSAQQQQQQQQEGRSRPCQLQPTCCPLLLATAAAAIAAVLGLACRRHLDQAGQKQWDNPCRRRLPLLMYCSRTSHSLSPAAFSTVTAALHSPQQQPPVQSAAATTAAVAAVGVQVMAAERALLLPQQWVPAPHQRPQQTDHLSPRPKLAAEGLQRAYLCHLYPLPTKAPQQQQQQGAVHLRRPGRPMGAPGRVLLLQGSAPSLPLLPQPPPPLLLLLGTAQGQQQQGRGQRAMLVLLLM